MELNQSNITNTCKTLISKPHYTICKKDINTYIIKTVIENNHYYLDKIIHFDLIKFIYEVNKDSFETIDLRIVNDNEANLYILVKHLFKELGAFQRYLSFKIQKLSYNNNNSIRFCFLPCNDYGNKMNQCNNATLAPIKQIMITFTIHNSHKIEMIQELFFEDSFIMNSMFEKIFVSILKKNTQQIVKALQCLK